MTSDERLMAYVDGELDGPERSAFEAQLASDPALAAEVARHRALGDRLFAAYAPVADEPLPAQLIAVASAANDVARPRFGLMQWAAMAACLVVGLLIGQGAMPQRGDLVMRDGRLAARGDLASALSRNLAADGGAVRVGVSFRSADGRYCRTFTSARQQLAGVACREADEWLAEATSAWRPAAAGAYRTAGSETPPAVLAAVDALIVGEPLDAAGERAARDRNWR